MWARNERKKGKYAKIIGCRNSQYIIEHQDYSNKASKDNETIRCICGKPMQKTNEHLNYVVWTCSYCGNKEVLWKGTYPWNAKKRTPQKPSETPAEIPKQVKCAILDSIGEVIRGMITDEHYLEKLEEEYID